MASLAISQLSYCPSRTDLHGENVGGTVELQSLQDGVWHSTGVQHGAEILKNEMLGLVRSQGIY